MSPGNYKYIYKKTKASLTLEPFYILLMLHCFMLVGWGLTSSRLIQSFAMLLSDGKIRQGFQIVLQKISEKKNVFGFFTLKLLLPMLYRSIYWSNYSCKIFWVSTTFAHPKNDFLPVIQFQIAHNQSDYRELFFLISSHRVDIVQTDSGVLTHKNNSRLLHFFNN